MILTHHTTERFTLYRSRTFTQAHGPKPSGLWVSVDDDWRRWIKDEDWGWDRLGWVCEVTVDWDGIVLLDTVEAIDAFTNKYGLLQLHTYQGESFADTYRIDWPTVAQEYKGIIIAPYQWDRRLDHSTGWYYGWDCASGCIWDMSAVIDVSRGRKEKVREPAD